MDTISSSSSNNNTRDDDDGRNALGSAVLAAPPSAIASARQLVASSQVTDDDVLLGRGKRSYNHEGNIRFRKIVLSRADAYRQNSNKAFRMALTLEVINRIESIGGRFLRQFEPRGDDDEEAEKNFELVAKSVVKTKVKQALRDTAAGLTAAEQQAVPRKALRMQSAQHPSIPMPQSIPFMNLLPNPISGNLFPATNPLLGQMPNSEYARLLHMVSLQQQLQEGQQTAAMMQALEQQRTMQLAQLMEQQNQNRAASMTSRLTPQQQQLLGLTPLQPPMTMTTTSSATTDDRRGIDHGDASGVGDLPSSLSVDQPLSLRSALYHQQIPTHVNNTDPRIAAASHYQHSNMSGTTPNLFPQDSSIRDLHTTLPMDAQQQQQLYHQFNPSDLQPLQTPNLFRLQQQQQQQQPLPSDTAFAVNALSQFNPSSVAAAARAPTHLSSSSSSSDGAGSGSDMQAIHRSLLQQKTPFAAAEDDSFSHHEQQQQQHTAATMMALRQQQQDFGLVSKPSMDTVDGIVQEEETDARGRHHHQGDGGDEDDEEKFSYR